MKRCGGLPALVLTAALSGVSSSAAAQGTRAPAQQLLEDVQHRAQQDAAIGRVPETTEGLDRLFSTRAKAANVELSDVRTAYDTAYERAKPTPGWWQSGWIAAAILLLIAIFRDFVKEQSQRALKAVGDVVYERLAGHRLL